MLGEPESFHYLNQSGCVSDPTINDVADFAKVSNSTLDYTACDRQGRRQVSIGGPLVHWAQHQEFMA